MGIELEFISNRADLRLPLMMCPLCQQILLAPVRCGICQSHFCQSCLISYLQTNQACPIDDSPMSDISKSLPPTKDVSQ